jgi:hypothetical protein
MFDPTAPKLRRIPTIRAAMPQEGREAARDT